MTFLKVNFETKEAILQSFDRIADKFAKDIVLKINDATYRIIDFEFYVYTANNKVLPDPHTHINTINSAKTVNCMYMAPV